MKPCWPAPRGKDGTLVQTLGWTLNELASLKSLRSASLSSAKTDSLELASFEVRRRKHISMKVRCYIDPQTGFPHIYAHDVSELEVEEVLERPAEDYQGNEGSRVAMGCTSTERTLRVIYAPGPEPNGVLITAYDLRGKPLFAHRRRKRRKPQ